MEKIVYDPTEERKQKKPAPLATDVVKAKIANNEVKVKGKTGKAKRETKAKEKRGFTIHGREFWLSKDEIQKEFGCEPKDVEKIWAEGKIGEPEKPKAEKPIFTDEQFIEASQKIGKPATSREISDALGIADPEAGRQLVRTRMAKLAEDHKVVITEAEREEQHGYTV